MNIRIGDAAFAGAAAPHWLSREATVAKPGFNRWLVPPAALAIHLCIGMSYGLSVFWLPLSRALSIGRTAPAACPDMSIATSLFTTACDWRVSDLVIVFSIGIVMLGLSAAVFGGWLERAGPRKAGLAAALCWGGGFLIGSLGVYLHQLWLIWIGMGVLGGIGLGLGYISPVSTLVKWFPDRRGMATGYGHHGLRRRRHDRLAARHPAHQLFQDTGLGRRLADALGDGRDLHRGDAVRRVRLPRAAGRLATQGMDRAGGEERDDQLRPRPSGPSSQDPAILAAMGDPLPQRLRRHRRPRPSPHRCCRKSSAAH